MNIFLYHPVAGLIRRLILISTIALCCYSGNALAEADLAEIQALKLKVEMLKMRVKELETIKNPKLNAKRKGGAWSLLVVGLSKAEVTALLGKPGRIDKWKTGEAWYFPNPRGGEVDFDLNGKVSGWLEP